MRVKYHFRNSRKAFTPHPFKKKSKWDPGSTTNSTLARYLELLLNDSPKTRSHIRANLSRNERKAIGQFRTDRSLVIKPIDKGSGIVIQDTSDYIRKGLANLSDSITYKKLPGDPNPLLVERIAKLIDSIYEAGYIDTHTHAYLKPGDNVRTQCMYFLTKLHKNPPGIRPIVSGCSGPTENISSFLDYIIKPLVPLTPSYIKDSSHVITLLETLRIPKKSFLVTIDVVSVYTNIPQHEGTQACLDAIEAANASDLDRDSLQALFDIVLV